MDLYHNNMSVCAQKVRLVLAAKELKVVEHHLDLGANDQLRPDYLKLNPNGVVPTLIDRGTPIVESTVICAYLEEAYPAISLSPRDPIERARMRIWMMRPDLGLHAVCGIVSISIAFREQILRAPPAALEKLLNSRRLKPSSVWFPDAIKSGVDAPAFAPALLAYRDAVVAMNDRLNANPWLVGDDFSLADITMLPYVSRLDHLAIDWIWKEMAGVTDWLKRCKSRASYNAVSNYLDPEAIDVMRRTGLENRAKLEAILG